MRVFVKKEEGEVRQVFNTTHRSHMSYEAYGT